MTKSEIRNKIFGEIERIIKDAIAKYNLDVNSGIFYMNGKNGTDWDWEENGHLSPFVARKGGKCRLRLFVNCDNSIDCYVYPNGDVLPTNEFKTQLNTIDAELLKEILERAADRQGLWNMGINNIDLSIFKEEF